MRLMSIVCALLTAASLPAQDLMPEWATTLAKIKRQNSAEFQRLPNYVCLQDVERFDKPPGAKVFRRYDTLKLQVAMVNGEELMAPADAKELQSGNPSHFSRAGALGTGTFSAFVTNVIVNDNGRVTSWAKEEIDGRPVWRYDYEIPAWMSGYRLVALNSDVIAGEKGSFWADAATLDLLRMEIHATEIPADFDIQAVVTRIDFGRTQLGGALLLMPKYAESLLTDIKRDQRKNQMTFSGCREYRADSVIKFDSDK